MTCITIAFESAVIFHFLSIYPVFWRTRRNIGQRGRCLLCTSHHMAEQYWVSHCFGNLFYYYESAHTTNRTGNRSNKTGWKWEKWLALRSFYCMNDGPLVIISTHCIQSLVVRPWKDSALLFPLSLSSSFLGGLGLEAQPFDELLTLAVAFTRWSIAQPLFQAFWDSCIFMVWQLMCFRYGLCMGSWLFDFLENFTSRLES